MQKTCAKPAENWHRTTLHQLESAIRRTTNYNRLPRRIFRNNLPRLITTIRGTEIKALIDSGSSDFAIRTTLLTDEQQQEIRSGPIEENLAADGVTLKLRGTIDLEVVINGKLYPTSFFVANSAKKCSEKLARSARGGTRPL